MTLLEICLDDVDGARIAENHGADRIELCAGLTEGGTTPSIGTVATVLGAAGRIGVRVLVRQRAGDFVYSAAEVYAMCADIEAIRALEAPPSVEVGFVIGALTPQGEIDVDATERMLRSCGSAPVTFHKAFDLTPDLGNALDTLIGLGVGRVLTSGGMPTALEGVSALAALVQRATGRIEILAAGGIRPHNVAEVIARSGVTEVHLRTGEPVESGSRVSGPPNPYDPGTRMITSATMIDDMRRAVNSGAAHE